jgi:hypothetical protein
MIFGSISTWLGKVILLVLRFLVFNILTGYQIFGLSNKKSMNGSWPPRLHRTMHGPRRPPSLLIRRCWSKYL